MKSGLLAFGALSALLLPAFAAPPAAKPAPRPTASPAPSSAALPAYLKQHCLGCHTGPSAKGALDLSNLHSPSSTLHPSPSALHKKWVQIHDRVAAGEMPPPGTPRPPAKETQTFLAALGGDLSARHAAQKGTVLRRLNRREYQNTLDDLLGTHVELMQLLPEDGRAHGFDTVGEALSISGLQMQRYMEAAELALNSVLQAGAQPKVATQLYTLDSERNQGFIGQQWLKRPDGAIVVFNDGGYPSTQLPGFRTPEPGRYRIKVTGYGFQIQEPVPFALITGTFNRGSDLEIRGFYELPPDRSGSVETTLTLRAGDSVKLSPQGLNGPDGRSPIRDGPDKYPGEGFALQSVEIEGPLNSEWPPRGQKLLLANAKLREIPPNPPYLRNRPNYRPRYTADSADPSGDSRAALGQFLTRAFRRPVTPADAAPYYALFDREYAESKDYLDAVRTAAIAALCSPEFLFLREPAGPLDDYALASRLSYFLTRSTPDAELLQLAAEKKLNRPEVLRAQTERLLRGGGLDRFVADFTDGWLNLREIDFTTPDRLLYPEFDPLLLDSMLHETRGFVRELFTANLPVSNLVHSDFAMLNSRLARHYNLPPVSGLSMRKVALPPDSPRGGLLTQASVLKVSANGTNTSPVIRGVWVMERLLGKTPSPPPPGIPGVEPDIRGARTIRESLDKHRNVETCNGCHREIDPPGFALESYDVIGGWRDRYRSLGAGDQVRLRVEGRNVRYRLGPPVDPSGQLPGGRAFQSFVDFRKLLLADQDRIARCLTEKLLVFATGRELGFSDRADLARITAETKVKGYPVRDLIHAAVQSPVFRNK